METIFLNAAGVVQFVRDDMEQGNWTQEEYSVNMTFPFDAGKVILRGMRVAFRDPATNNLEFFEIRNVTNIEPEHYQQIIGESIAVSELSDEHINNDELTDLTAAQALTGILTGTLWSVGTNTASGTSSGDIGRGSVWQAVNAIMTNWNVYITPRVTVNNAGSITGRYLDISPAQGTWRGVRLSIDKNMEDASVVYDDSEVVTALYGYGGMEEVEQEETYNTSQEVTFKDVVWSATSEHPAKPAGQAYLEDPAKTALYGRNGRPRFGYYQNADITDAETLLEKTWETLKTSCNPKIRISGTATDLYRLGYKDEPLRLHDTVIVEIRQTGETFQKEIIRLDVDLIDPTATRPEIGDYIPNIIYINRDTNEIASTGTTGGRGGGGGGRGGTNASTYEYNTYSGFEKLTDEYGSMIGMVVGKKEGDEYIKAAEIVLSINATTGETMAKIQADHVWMGTGVDEKPIDVVIDGKLTTTELETEIGLLTSVRMNTVNVTTLIDSPLFTGTEAQIDEISCDQFNGEFVEWVSKSVVTSVGSTSFTKSFRLSDGTTWDHKVVTDVSYNTTTINYLSSY